MLDLSSYFCFSLFLMLLSVRSTPCTKVFMMYVAEKCWCFYTRLPLHCAIPWWVNKPCVSASVPCSHPSSCSSNSHHDYYSFYYPRPLLYQKYWTTAILIFCSFLRLLPVRWTHCKKANQLVHSTSADDSHLNQQTRRFFQEASKDFDLNFSRDVVRQHLKLLLS